MHIFFHGWRRKLGVVTLVLGCVMLCGWMRSLSNSDSIQIPVTQRSRMTFGSANRIIGVSYETFDHSSENVFEFWSNPDAGRIDEALSMDGIMPSHRVIDGEDDEMLWLVRYNGFLFGQSAYLPDFESKISFAAVPYWSVTVLLTLVSACLILVPSRTRPRHASQHDE